MPIILPDGCHGRFELQVTIDELGLEIAMIHVRADHCSGYEDGSELY